MRSSEPRAAPRGRYLATLALAALGVVYGDIGTSPLYAIRYSFSGTHGIPVTPGNVLGVLSLVFWSLLIVVTIKYHIVIIRADNKGEGGVLALMALVNGSRVARGLSPRRLMIVLGIFGSALLYADGGLTPAISVLSAVEGLEIATPALASWVIPVTLVILISLFLVQRRGTARIGAMFGPVMLVWFAVIGVLGLGEIIRQPGVLAAVSPVSGVRFFAENVGRGFVVLGAVFLVVTGGEALYADLGHFGHRAIQIAWFSTAFPCLLLNYFGQGAKALADPTSIENPFYRLVPETLLLPMVVLATAATVIASQAVITGAYSLVRQAIQLGLLPRLAILHTSASQAGQIYIPRVTGALLVGVLLLVGLFRTSSALASAYGIAVATTMVVDGLLAFLVIWKFWHWPLWRVGIVVAPLVLVDVVFFSANLLKLLEGAWAPILFGASMVLLILTWRRGTSILAHKTRRSEVPLDILLASLQKHPPHMVPGTAVFLTSQPEFAPTALLHNLKHNKVLHEHNVILTVVTTDTPRVTDEERVKITVRSPHFSSMTLKFGYMESPNVPKALAVARKHGWHFDIMSTSFFLSRRALKPASHSAMPRWQDRLFIGLAKSASDATDFFHIPTGRVVEVGTQVAV